MARLIHLNGPSRVGKSTLAHRYADTHPGTLCLDIDVLIGQVDGWRELHGRPATIQFDTTGLTIDQTYVRLVNLLGT